MISPLNNKLLVRLNVEREHTRYGDILIPDTAKSRHTSIATVIAVGKKVTDIEVGDRVIMPETGRGTPLVTDNITHYMIPEENILAVLDG